ncbi:elongation factor P [Tropheryma whipplei]|uniref:Elongation factor P n=2 Tax=Tropheryma whipplei TaxID=2039 RepID=EFP_TROWT|nr:elongation factor P [Tropheryma whipplei]Q83MW6.1 RecName: Full=Elongation factor P; Short=EF-P [Tropheryma whipplei str. Twist]Q83NK8.1 RecName: Full=Elongation factor P; Short=EF-P [Tropheryma whipplei TW08/27]AAO44465.1 elongation factor EF-P [Tropheryma whipplei str. Twist]MCO8182371.1 elongation factor P [Tropheryma whipplei]CAD67072.1 elongation factor P [Tropheryma whipplei TW08/27]
MASTSDIRNGVVLNINGQLNTVIEFQHVKPGKGGAFVRTKLKNILTGKVVDKTFNAGASVVLENVDRRDCTYLYRDADSFVFMDLADYDQIRLTASQVASAANYLSDNQKVVIATHNNAPLYVDLPPSVVLAVTHTEPGVQADRSTGGTKPATLETGYQIQVPLFITVGTRIRVDTRTGAYIGKA